MGTYCYDQFKHPLLWCDEKKKLIERKNAEESMRLWLKKKADNLARIEKEKKEYNEMSITYCPWGRPGGGAPNYNIRMRDITAEGLHPTQKCIIRNSATQPYHVNIPSAKTAQIRSAADRMYITLKENSNTKCKEKKHLDIELRYKTLKNKKNMQLEKIILTEKPKWKLKKRKTNIEEPWIKPGPLGIPWRNPKGVGNNSFTRSLECTNKALLKETNKENSEIFPETKDEMTKTFSTKEELKRCCSLCNCECPVTSITLESHKSQVNKQNINKVSKSENVGQNNLFSRAASKNINLTCNSNCRAKEIYKTEKDVKQKEYVISNRGIELVPMPARQHRIHRPVSLSSTDVIKQTEKNRFTHFDVDYLNELNRQMKEKQKYNHLCRKTEQQLCNTHFQTFETFWGRPGHGAPRSVKTKLNLDYLLYGIPAAYEY